MSYLYKYSYNSIRPRRCLCRLQERGKYIRVYRIICIVIPECCNRPACVPKALPPILRFGGQVGRQGIQNIENLRSGCPLSAGMTKYCEGENPVIKACIAKQELRGISSILTENLIGTFRIFRLFNRYGRKVNYGK